MTTITALPPPPSRDDPANFAARGDDFLAALPTFVTETNTVASEVNEAASNASTSASTASNHATTATTQAGIATTQAGNASTSASDAAAQAALATTQANNAAASYDAFDDRYLGSKAANPALDNDGSALVTGALYWNTVVPEMRVFDGVVWRVAAGSVSADFNILREVHTATANQTVFNLANGYVVGTNAVMVYQNGSRLIGADYTETSSNVVTLTTGATLNDELLFEIGVAVLGSVQTATNTTFTPAGSIAATNVQAALAELDSEKQAYDPDTAKTDVAQSWTAQQTFKEVKDTVYTIPDGAAFEIDPANGSVQVVTLGASRTPAATNFEDGQTVLLGIDDGAAYSVTWTTVAPTWLKVGGTGAAPALATSGYTWVLLFKQGSTIFGVPVGSP